MPRKVRPVIDRLLEKIRIDPETGCWIWIAGKNNTGYGVIGMRENGKSYPRLAHRVSYTLHKGPIPDGLHLDHLCRTPLCVNPEHLEPVTNRENTLRGDVPTSVCPAGHEFTPENTYVSPRKETGHPQKQCRKCRRAAWQRHYERRRRLGVEQQLKSAA